MTFSVRVALLTAGAVAVAGIGAAFLMFFVVQNQLVTQIDQSLGDAAQIAKQSGPLSGRPAPGGRPGPFGGDPGRIAGRADVFAQSIDANGTVIRADLNQPDKAIVTQAATSV